jgi:hypothetical protein
MYAITITLRALPGHGETLVAHSLATVEPSRAEPECRSPFKATWR